MSALADLLRRVEAAEGPDRWIDRDLAEQFCPAVCTRERRAIVGDQFSWMHPEYGLTRCEPYTASLDAALGLVERVLPGWRPTIKNVDIRGHEWRVTLQCWRDGHHAWGSTAALALLAAMLKALIATGNAEPAQVENPGSRDHK